MIDVGCQKYFACDECPIVAQLDRRLAVAAENPEYGDFQFDHCGCDKVYDEFFWCGYCEDAWVDMPAPQKSGKRQTGRAYRRKMHWKHIKKFCDRHITRPCLVPYPNYGYVDDEWEMIGTHICYPHNSKNKVFFKRVSNKRVRMHKFDLPQKGNGYHKVFDYWWTLY